MDIPSKSLTKAIDQLSSLPGIGKKTATRLALKLISKNKDEILEFGESFISLAENLSFCKVCFNVSDHDICDICSNSNRNNKVICVVEDVRDVIAIENTMQYKGVYHVLGGIISPMDGIGPKDLRIDELIERCKEVEEVFLALNASMEGETTSFYIYKKIKDLDLKITSIARGISVGDELQYADEITLGRSIINRTTYQAGI